MVAVAFSAERRAKRATESPRLNFAKRRQPVENPIAGLTRFPVRKT